MEYLLVDNFDDPELAYLQKVDRDEWLNVISKCVDNEIDYKISYDLFSKNYRLFLC